MSFVPPMRQIVGAFLICSALFFASSSPARAAAWDRPGWRLTFQDEFDGASLDSSKWVKRYKWGQSPINSELQAYVDDAFQIQSGILSIVGDKRTATYGGQSFSYASGVMCSVLEQKYGYFEARVKVPAGQGLWPAFWLLGNTSATGVNEIDVHEIIGNDTTKTFMNVHWGADYTTGKDDSTSWVGPDFSADFHVFGLEWSQDTLIWTIDGTERKRHTGTGVPQVEMYLILNLAIGGSWPGSPNASTVFPARYQIDYVRAYTRDPNGGGTPDGGAGATGGATGATGGMSGATGGKPGTGGMGGAGGAPSGATGGKSGTGGSATGGSNATGGATATGGGAGPTGGTSSGTGGAGTGGSVATGGTTATGGSKSPGTTGGTDGGTPSDDGGGCACAVGSTPSPGWTMASLIAAAAFVRRRRRS